MELSAKGIIVSIIGCGDYELIESYVKETGSKYPLYTDPSQKLHKAFGFARTLALGKKPDYMSFGIWRGVMKGISSGIKARTKVFNAGDVKQVGGE